MSYLGSLVFCILNRIMKVGKEVIVTIKLSADSVNFSRSVYRLNTECRYESYMTYVFQIIGLVNICILYSFYCVIPRGLNFMFRRFGTLCSIFIGRVDKKTAYEDGRNRVSRNVGI